MGAAAQKMDAKDTKIFQNALDGLYADFKSGKLIPPKRRSKGVSNAKYSEDFANFYSASQDIYSGSGSGTQYDAKSLLELRFLSEERLGTGYAISHDYSKTALFNWFKLKKIDSKRSYFYPKGWKKWIRDSDFKNQSIVWDGHKRAYGVGLLVKYYKAYEDMSTPAPNTPPKKFQVISPLTLAPTNTYSTRMLDYDEEMWEFMGGNLRVKKIHKSRIEIIRGTPRQSSWRGLAVLETNYLALICYYNAIIYLTRGLAKFGTNIPVMKTGSVIPTSAQYKKYLAIMEEFIANNFFILGKNDELIQQPSGIGAGLYEILEILKEEICAGTNMTLNYLYGRAASGGMSGEGALSAERKMMQGFVNEQTEISDDYIDIFNQAGFDFEDLELDWNLALMKTTEQELMERQMELNNELLEQQVKMSKGEVKMLDAQQELFDENKHLLTGQQQLQEQERIKEDFRSSKQRLDDYFRLQRIISTGSKSGSDGDQGKKFGVKAK